MLDNDEIERERLRELSKLRAEFYEGYDEDDASESDINPLLRKDRKEALKDLNESLEGIDLDDLE